MYRSIIGYTIKVSLSYDNMVVVNFIINKAAFFDL